jgi:hypothetical protein
MGLHADRDLVPRTAVCDPQLDRAEPENATG